MPTHIAAVTQGADLKVIMYPTLTVSSVTLAHGLSNGEAAAGIQCPFRASQFKEDIENLGRIRRRASKTIMST